MRSGMDVLDRREYHDRLRYLVGHDGRAHMHGACRTNTRVGRHQVQREGKVCYQAQLEYFSGGCLIRH